MYADVHVIDGVSTPDVQLGRLIQHEHDRGRTWSHIAADLKIAKSTAQRLARVYRQYCDQHASKDQLTLF